MRTSEITYKEPKIIIEKNGIAFTTLARPPLNAFDRSMYDQTCRIFKKIGDDPKVNVILLTGQGHVFCVGNDLNDFVDFFFETANVHLAHARPFFNVMYGCPVPIVGAINGAAVGTGLSIAGKNHMASRLCKKGLNRVESMNLKEGYEFECALTAPLRKNPDMGEDARNMLM